MNFLTLIMAAVSLLAAADLILGNKLGLGKEFEKGIHILGTLTLSMLGMIIVAPSIAHVMENLLHFLPSFIDPSIIPAILFANDMGGAPLCMELGTDPQISAFNSMVVSSMMGCTVSFTIPFVMGAVSKEHREDTLFGLLCGIVAIPAGCVIGGLICGLPFGKLLLNLIPLLLFSALLAVGLSRFPAASVRIFSLFGSAIQILITIGLAAGIFEFLTGIKLIPYSDTIQTGMDIVLNIACVMTGVFPLLHLLTKVLRKPLSLCSSKLGINDTAMMGLIATLATSVTTFDLVKKMNRKGIILNAAFAVPAAFVLADHLAFTMAFHPDYLLSVTVSKLAAGILAVLLAAFLSRKRLGKHN